MEFVGFGGDSWKVVGLRLRGASEVRNDGNLILHYTSSFRATQRAISR